MFDDNNPFIPLIIYFLMFNDTENLLSIRSDIPYSPNWSYCSSGDVIVAVWEDTPYSRVPLSSRTALYVDSSDDRRVVGACLSGIKTFVGDKSFGNGRESWDFDDGSQSANFFWEDVRSFGVRLNDRVTIHKFLRGPEDDKNSYERAVGVTLKGISKKLIFGS
ncbi:hypothetical protein COU61_02550 [Candidatus Pacearchaeota archaeon CG10_big_fil_rev_8_21_14_0_10_35_13]|nr:MAG: hypothetical protein COU61_02550 [Candidatus Pacearchaeota archaeon CG10_big_fil_rev_8_21_14_0_10_35_13]